MSGRIHFFYNMDTCIGCGSCQVACKDRHHLLPGEFFRRVLTETVETPEGERQIFFSAGCNHCENPACAAVCPTGAMHKLENGAVLHEDSLCIGCGRCYWACPYGEVSLSRTKGISQKCDLCGELREQGLPPACIAACPTNSLRLETEEAGERLELLFLPSFEETEPSTRVKLPRAMKQPRGAEASREMKKIREAEVEP